MTKAFCFSVVFLLFFLKFLKIIIYYILIKQLRIIANFFIIKFYFSSYKNIYFNTNNTARMYINGFTSFALPQIAFNNTYEIIPIEIPSEIL